VKCNSASGFVCISQNGDILGTAVLVGGVANLVLDKPASGDELTITITALNTIPYISTIQVLKEPASPGACLPENHSKLQSINRTFSWDCGIGGSPDSYKFFLGTDNPPTNLVNGQKITSTEIKPLFNLEYNKTYYWKVISENSFGTAESRVMEFSTVFDPDEDFESAFKNRYKWESGGMQKWETDASDYFDGVQSIRSGKINNNEYSSLVFPCEVETCDFVSFWSKTSSDQGDKLQFMIDGKIIDEWSGLRDWSFHIYRVEPGTHSMEWRYIKNGSLSSRGAVPIYRD
jgi:hypothetical protein